MNLAEHPTVRRFHERTNTAESPKPLDTAWLRQLCLDCGADDAGLVEISRPALQDQRDDILRAFPPTKTLLTFVCRMNREPIRSPARSVANLEFHHTGDHVNEVARKVVATLEKQAIRAMNPSMGVPMEMDRFSTGKIWVVSHKPVAVAAGLGHMGIHRNVIHPRFGNFILLGTVLIGAEATAYDQPISYNPCLECKLCVAACPVGAISPDGHFNFSACSTHNYREFMGGFTDWVEQIADSKDALDYRKKVSDPESASMWQSLSFGPNYKAAYCLSVCPAGEEVIGPYLSDKAAHLREIVRPLQEKQEAVYVVPGSDAEEHVARRFPLKTIKRVGNGLRPRSVQRFLSGLRLTFQPGKAAQLNAVFHFTFTGKEEKQVTVTIRDGTLQVQDGHQREADLRVTADSETWLGFLAKERSLLWALLRRRIRIKGSPKMLVVFGKCFPSWADSRGEASQSCEEPGPNEASAKTITTGFEEKKMSSMIQEKNKALVLEAFDTLFNKRDYAAALRFWSPNYIQHSAHIGPGREGLFRLVKSLPSTLRYKPGTIIADEEFVIVHGRYSGFGQPANWIVADIVRIADGVLAEHWDVIQDEATQEQSKSGLPMFGTRFPVEQSSKE